MPMPNPFAHMAEYASQCYIAHVADAAAVMIKDPNSITLTPPPTIAKKCTSKRPRKRSWTFRCFTRTVRAWFIYEANLGSVQCCLTCTSPTL